ncbi:hypothetical protein D9758_016901 [Tetrapyrgos nigripes]|uniref:GmrSD restriction endonucleases N-terminal domain-containing protein n=1 Tax=Tetrapyrgos nigripes TaxID=182062 RepID=A0A8H5FF09_9AGAR|nr:hypothetical protein D9758_016901 [Tetrapyrgos nigripes]
MYVVWTKEKQTGLIDSILRNFYIPPVIFVINRDDDGNETKTCIDGKQRLTSIHRFMDGLIPHRDPITNKKFWYKIDPSVDGGKKGPTGRLLPQQYRDSFAGKYIVCVEYTNLTDTDEREIYQRVQLGMALTSAEKLHFIANSYLHTYLPSTYSLQKKTRGDLTSASGTEYPTLAIIGQVFLGPLGLTLASTRSSIVILSPAITSILIMPEHSSLPNFDDILQRHRAGTFIFFLKAPQLQVTHESCTKEHLDALAEIKHREIELFNLRIKAARLNKLSSLITALSAPIRKLPPEILSRVPCYEPSPKSPNFLSVCSHWRDLGLSFPEIWSEVSLVLSTSYYGRRFKSTALKSHLQRSKACSLSVNMSFEGVLTPATPSDAQAASRRMIELVVWHAARWKKLSVRGSGRWDPLTVPLRPITTTFPFLETFAYTSSEERSSTISIILSRSLSLRTLATHIFPVDLHTVPTFDTIMTLRLLIRKDLTVLKLLEKCPNVVSLTYDLSQLCHDVAQTPIMPQISNSIDHLCIQFCALEESMFPGYGRQPDTPSPASVMKEEFFPRLLASFTFPNLKSLCMRTGAKGQLRDLPWPRKEFIAFLNRSDCEITRLVLLNWRISKQQSTLD